MLVLFYSTSRPHAHAFHLPFCPFLLGKSMASNSPDFPLFSSPFSCQSFPRLFIWWLARLSPAPLYFRLVIRHSFPTNYQTLENFIWFVLSSMVVLCFNHRLDTVYVFPVSLAPKRKFLWSPVTDFIDSKAHYSSTRNVSAQEVLKPPWTFIMFLCLH